MNGLPQGSAWKRRLSFSLALAGAAALVCSQILCWLRIGSFPYYFYLIAWYCTIVILDHLVYWRRGTSLLMDRPGECATMMIWSAGLWLLFEGINLRLQNWVYLEAEPLAPLRYGIGIVSFATVLPGIFETTDFLDAMGFFRQSVVLPRAMTGRRLGGMLVCGVLFLVLPLLWPTVFFPLIWGSFIFLLAPVNYRARSDRSLLGDLSRGSVRRFVLLLAAGAVCGILWEGFNYWAATKWEYHVPFVGGWKLFEMPVLGYLGFPPFAVECWVVYTTILLLRQRLTARLGRLGAVLYVAAAVAFTTGLAVVVFPRADRITIKSFRDRIETGRPQALAAPSETGPGSPKVAGAQPDRDTERTRP